MNSYDHDPLTLSADARIDALVESERDIARVQARQVRVIAAIADDPCADAVAPALEKEYFREEIRAALGESAITVSNRIMLARELTGRLSVTLTAVEDGSITLRHARLLAETAFALADADALDVQASVLPFAAGRDLAAFGRKVRREVFKRDHRSVEEQVAAALADRRVWMRPGYPCLTQVGALLPADGAQLLMTAIDLVASRNPADDGRTADQQRADALVQLAVDALNGYASCAHCPRGSDGVIGNDNSEHDYGAGARIGAAGHGTGPGGGSGGGDRSTQPRWQGARPTIQVTVALSTLLGLDEQPGELDGYGPVPADLALRMAAEDGATWRRLVTDNLGHLLDYGRTTYRPPADLRNYVIARDRTCMFPTCNRRACRCEIDHVRAWEDGGQTSAENLTVLCCRHHHGKHEAGWQLRRLPDGGIEWTSPTGHVYMVPASTYPIDTTHDVYTRNDNTEHPATQGDPDPPTDPPTDSDADSADDEPPF
ncbi:MAG: DUF222 domain-containing protein [Jatrophihabitantaceae bacterium]